LHRLNRWQIVLVAFNYDDCLSTMDNSFMRSFPIPHRRCWNTSWKQGLI
jgi:hypothetical protein